MKKLWGILLAAMLLVTAGCGGTEKILSTEGAPQELLSSAGYKAALAEEEAAVIAFNGVPMTDSAPVRAAVAKLQNGGDAVLTYYNFHQWAAADPQDTRDKGLFAFRLTQKDGVLAYQDDYLTDWESTVQWGEKPFYRAADPKLNDCGYFSFLFEDNDAPNDRYLFFCPEDRYEGYNERYALTETYLQPIAWQCYCNFTDPEEITANAWLRFFTSLYEGDLPMDGETASIPLSEMLKTLLPRFEISETALRAILTTLEGYRAETDTVVYYTGGRGGLTPLPFAESAVQQGDLLQIRYGVMGLSADDLPADRLLTVRLQEDGGWKYVSNTQALQTTAEGVTELKISEALPQGCLPLPADPSEDLSGSLHRPALLQDGTVALLAVKGNSFAEGAPLVGLFLPPEGETWTETATGLTYGNWLRNIYGEKEGRFTGVMVQGNCLVLRTEYSTNVGTTMDSYRPDRYEETWIRPGGSVEQKSGPVQGLNETASPDGSRVAARDNYGNLLVNGTVVLDAGNEHPIWEYDRYYVPDLWADNDRLIFHEGVYKYMTGLGAVNLSTGEVQQLPGRINQTISSIFCLGDTVYWSVNEQFCAGGEEPLTGERVLYAMPAADFPQGEAARMVMPQTTDWPRLLTDGRLWSARYQQETLELTVFDPETGSGGSLSIPVAAGDAAYWTVPCMALTPDGLALLLEGSDDTPQLYRLVRVPNALLTSIPMERQPSLMEQMQPANLDEVFEIFSGRWQQDWEDGESALFYRQDGDCYYRFGEREPEKLVSVSTLGETGYYFTTVGADGNTGVLLADTGKPKDNRILLQVYIGETYPGEFVYRGE